MAGLWLGHWSVPEENPTFPRNAGEPAAVAQQGAAAQAVAPEDPSAPPLYFHARMDSMEDWNTVSQEAALAAEAGINRVIVPVTLAWTAGEPGEDVLAKLKRFVEVNPRAAFALAHSEATPAQARRFKRYGLKIQTHCMNATGRAPVPRGTRGSGPDEFCLSDPDVYAELISDSEGIHVCADQQRLILRAKGVDRVILITDSTKSDGTSPERLRHIRDLNFDANGDLCGSKLTLDVACRNIMAHTGCGIAQAFLMAARNPADAVGLGDEVGTIEAGKRANLVFVDDMFHVNRVILNGETVAIDR